MRATKKIIALVMAIAMISTCGVSTAFANVNAADTDTSKPVVPTTEYNITVTGAENATVSIKVGDVEVKKAAADAKVTVTVTAKTGFGVTSVMSSDASIVGTNPSGTVFTGTFTMPASNVSIAVATYAAIPGTLYINSAATENGSYSFTVGGKATTSAKADDVVTVVTKPAGTNVYEVEKIICKTTPGNKSVEVKDNVFTMPNSSVIVTVTFKKIPIKEPEQITPEDVTLPSTDGMTAGGVVVDEIKATVASDAAKAVIDNVMDNVLKRSGLKTISNVGAFTPIDITIKDVNGKVLTGTLKKPVDITITITTPGFVPTTKNMRILHNHKGTVEVIRVTKVSSLGSDKYEITFPMSRFSTVMPVAVETDTTSGGSTGSSGSSYSGGSSGGGGGATESSFDGSKMRLTGGETVSAATVEAIAGTDKVYTVNYRGKDYTFNGKNVAKPGKGVIYYSAEEFMKLVQGKLVSATGSTSNDTGNPDTGANDFAGLAMALAMVSLAGIAACNVAKKK